MNFELTAPYEPTGDQPEAIREIVASIREGNPATTLLGVTGSGKTFTMANVIAQLGRPTLILSHNKTLAAQLYSEFKNFFPKNLVEYFVSYYDYYQPEAYLPTTDTYIEKDLSINDEIEKLRLSATSALLSGRRDVIVVSSVSCLYGIGNPDDFHETTVRIETGQTLSRQQFLYSLVDALYSRNEAEFKRGTFRVKGDSVDIFLAYGDYGCRVVFFGDEIESIERIDPVSGATLEFLHEISIYPANNFVTTKERTRSAIATIQDDLVKQCAYFEEIGKHLEAKRLKTRVEYDLEMIKEVGYCPGIENYSRYFDGRSAGMRPFCLIDYFPDDFLTFIDESHVTVPQIRAMSGGDRSRKQTLIEYGFRLPAAADNRPLRFDEFEAIVGQRLYVSATPGDFELEESGGVVVEQVVRPTGLLDPPIEVRPIEGQIDDLLEEIQVRAELDERVLVTTLTKRMAEELDKYLTRMDIRTRYIHSDVDTLERVEILEDFKAGRFDVLVGVNLLRPAHGLARSDPRRRQGRIPPLRPEPHPDCRPRRAQRARPRDHVRRQDHRIDAGHHRRYRAPACQADGLQRGARHRAHPGGHERPQRRLRESLCRACRRQGALSGRRPRHRPDERRRNPRGRRGGPPPDGRSRRPTRIYRSGPLARRNAGP